MRDFRVSLHMHNFFQDHRCICRIFVSKSMETIKDLMDHITKIFNIGEFYLITQNHYLPDEEDIRILQPDDTLIALPTTIPISEKVATNVESHKHTPQKKKKSKKLVSEIGCASNSVLEEGLRSKRKKISEGEGDDVNSNANCDKNKKSKNKHYLDRSEKKSKTKSMCNMKEFTSPYDAFATNSQNLLEVEKELTESEMSVGDDSTALSSYNTSKKIKKKVKKMRKSKSVSTLVEDDYISQNHTFVNKGDISMSESNNLKKSSQSVDSFKMQVDCNIESQEQLENENVSDKTDNCKSIKNIVDCFQQNEKERSVSLPNVAKDKVNILQNVTVSPNVVRNTGVVKRFISQFTNKKKLSFLPVTNLNTSTNIVKTVVINNCTSGLEHKMDCSETNEKQEDSTKTISEKDNERNTFSVELPKQAYNSTDISLNPTTMATVHTSTAGSNSKTLCDLPQTLENGSNQVSEKRIGQNEIIDQNPGQAFAKQTLSVEKEHIRLLEDGKNSTAANQETENNNKQNQPKDVTADVSLEILAVNGNGSILQPICESVCIMEENVSVNNERHSQRFVNTQKNNPENSTIDLINNSNAENSCITISSSFSDTPGEINPRLMRKSINKFGIGTFMTTLHQSCDHETSIDGSLSDSKPKRKRVRKRKIKITENDSNIFSNTTVSSIYFAPPNTQSTPRSHIKFADDDVGNGDSQRKTFLLPHKSNVNNVNNDCEIDTNKCRPMNNLKPQKDNIIMFKMLKMNSNYVPVVSDMITGKVVDFDETTEEVRLDILDGSEEFEVQLGKFSIEDENAAAECVNGMKSVQWSDLIQPHLLCPSIVN